MDYYQIIAERFQGTIEHIAMSVDRLAGPIAQGGELMAQVLLQDGRIFCCGNGPDASLSQLFCTSLLSHLDQERPALPAFNLSADSATLTAINSQEGADETFSRQLRSLGQEGDLLLALHSGGDDTGLDAAVEAAHDRGMLVVAVTSQTGGALAGALRPGDANIPLDAMARSTRIELQTMIVNNLCQLIEYNLFGSYHQDQPE